MRNGKVRSRLILLSLLSATCNLVFFVQKTRSQESQAPAGGTKWKYDEIKRAPEKARIKQNPLGTNPDAVRAGGKLFERYCVECHGMKAEGGKRGPSLLREEVQNAPAGTLFWVLSNGAIWHGMPDWSRLPEAQRWQIIAFLKSLHSSASLTEPQACDCDRKPNHCPHGG